MSNGTIQISNLSKQYRIGELGYHTLREDLTNWVKHRIHTNHSYIWALKDINLSISKGESVAIMGANGSGKTTLLRCISQVTYPTSGEVIASGRLGVLIELMAGFHPELTGKQNTYLNGVIMGLARKEVKEKMPDIFSFAEIANFADTPLKRYSTGMNIKLGFAVATCVNPDILLTDEVLAVCDLNFQKKAIDYMAILSKKGVTILFVSHNLELAERVCQRGILLSKGQVLFDGKCNEAIRRYRNEK
jgi:lipopolysaccharide transport system ATP-binding protein